MFPFSAVRPVQKNFMDDVTTALQEKKHLIANAPTGLGKTVATIVPCLAYAMDNGKTVFFLTPKHSQHQIAVETLRMIKEKANRNCNQSTRDFITTDLIGKKWLCSVMGIDEMTNSEFNDYCRAMVKEERCRFYNNTRTKNHTMTHNAVQFLNILKERQPLHAEEAKELCHETCCTYELLSELAKQSTVIIGDYYHVFSPLRKAMFTRIKKEVKDAIFIVDEAHNLPQRVRELASKKMSTYSLSGAEKESRAFGFHEMQSTFRELAGMLRSIQIDRLGKSSECFIEKSLLIDMIESKIGKLDELIADFSAASEIILESKKKSFIGSAAQFLAAWTGDDEGYSRIAARSKMRTGKDMVTITYRCLDPRLFTKEIMDESHTTILMSGTLFPMEMYRDILGLSSERTLLRTYQTPFPRKNRLNIFITDATTQYSKRTNANFSKIANYVTRCCNAIQGNVAVFFPSYYLRDVVYEMLRNAIGKEVILEQQNSNKAERRKLYELFISRHEKGAAFFGVMAGSFSEGMDYPGRCLNGVIVVGIPLEIPNLESKALIDYYDAKFKRGWDYGYIYPAMVRSIQAAGRCIRSESDRGVCVFIDERFLWGNYRKVFPADMAIKITNEPEKEIKTFFEQAE